MCLLVKRLNIVREFIEVSSSLKSVQVHCSKSTVSFSNITLKSSICFEIVKSRKVSVSGFVLQKVKIVYSYFKVYHYTVSFCFSVQMCGLLHSPEEEEVGVVLHHGVGLAGQVAQAGQVEPGSGRDLQHAAPSLVTQQLHLRGVQQPFLRALVPVAEREGQRVVQTARHAAHGLPVFRQDAGVHDDLRQLRPAALTQRPPLGRQLAAVRKRVRARKNAKSSDEESRGKHPEVPERSI